MGAVPFTTEIQAIGENLWGVYLVPEVALREYGALVLKSQRLVTLLFDNRYAEGFFHGAPGLREWALLGKAWFHTTETAPDGAPRFDVVLFDAPATGHGVDMLRVPKVILSAAPPGRLRSDAERAYASFQDPSFSAFVVVTLPEELPTNETLELVSVLDGELGLRRRRNLCSIPRSSRCSPRARPGRSRASPSPTAPARSIRRWRSRRGVRSPNASRRPAWSASPRPANHCGACRASPTGPRATKRRSS